MSETDVPHEASSGTLEGAEPFRIVEEHPPWSNVCVLVLYGELDLHVGAELRDRLTAAIDAGAKYVVLDLTRVAFIDSMALGVLLGALKRLRERGGELRLVVPNPELRRIFEITLLDQLFTISSTRHEALASFMEPWGA